MCEMLVARSDRPFRLAALWALTGQLERFGIAGFGWGAAWLGDGAIERHVDVRAFRDDPASDALGAVVTTAALVHLRRPSKLSTLGPADAQPFVDPAGRFAFGHNGDFREHRPWRRRYLADGRIGGRADSEVGCRRLEDLWDEAGPEGALAALHGELGGVANLMTLEPDGTGRAYAGNAENPLFRFRLDGIDVIATGIYSLDRSLFRYVVPHATDRRLVRYGKIETLRAVPVTAEAG